MPAITSRRAATAGRTSTLRALLRFTATGGHTSRLVTTITLLLLAALFLAGCSTSIKLGGRDTVDPARITDAIRRQLQVPADLQLRSVACPRGVKLAEGATFQCTADVEGALLPITVTLSHVDTDTGSFDYNFKLAKALINTDKAVKELQSKLPVELVNATVDCGTPRVRVVEVGARRQQCLDATAAAAVQQRQLAEQVALDLACRRVADGYAVVNFPFRDKTDDAHGARVYAQRRLSSAASTSRQFSSRSVR